jgi:hypothetical protein
MTEPNANQRTTSSRGPFEPELAALAAGLALALVDLLLLGRARPEPFSSLAIATLGLVLASATLLALVTRAALALGRHLGAGRWRASLVGALLALPVILPVAILLFRGTGISNKPYASYGPFLCVPLGLAATAVGLRIAGAVARRARGRRARWLLLPPLLLGAGLLGWADRTLYPHQYLYLHWLLLLLTVLSLMAAAWSGFAHARPSRSARRIAPLLLALAIPVLIAVSILSLRPQRERLTLATRTHVAGRIAALLRDALDLDRDHHSVILGERDCDNSDPAVHPFAIDLPGNGVDEDCDGSDARPAPLARRPDPALDADGYRLALARWRREPALARRLAATARMNVVLILVDALRADQVIPSVANRENHPRMLRLLGESRSFRRAFSTGAGTDIGMATLFTGQLDPFARSNLNLLQVYQRAGVRTHGVFQREVERWVGRQLALDGLDGRKIVVNDPGRRDVGTVATSRMVSDQGIRFLAEHPGQRFFLWLHYFDTHEHHQIDPRRLPERFRAARGLPFYRSMIRLVDEEVGRFLDALAASKLAERTIVVLAADHGEGLATEARLPGNHGDVLYNPLVHVPLGFRIPGLEGASNNTPVSLADVYPTLCDLSGVAGAPGFGLSLTPHLFTPDRPELGRVARPLLLYEARQQAIIRWPFKLIAWQDQGLYELYDLERDFAEAKNLADERTGLAGELARELVRHKLITIDRLAGRRRR